MKKDLIITVVVILAVIILAYIIMGISKPSPLMDKDVAECIGGKTTLYVQLGCHACEAQEEIFGENYKYLNVVDCFYEREKCEDIRVTPTWKIDEELIEGAYSIEKLKGLTGC